MNNLEILFETYTGNKPNTITEFVASGSNRKYFRIESDHETLIGVEGTSVEENNAFIAMAKHFGEKSLPVPTVLAQSEDGLYYLQEDLGDSLLFDFISGGRKTGVFSVKEKDILRKTLQMLPSIQVKGAEGFDFSVCYPHSDFNERSILWDLNYFKYCFLKATGLDFLENKLEDDFKRFSNILLSVPAETFMYRDFQTRNVMLKDDSPFFIDFQGGRRGPLHYDVASFLWQAKANFSDELREELIDDYLEALAKIQPVEKEEFCDNLKHFVLFRMMQVLGAYGFRGYFEKKPHFLQSIPYALANLKVVLKNDLQGYPYLIDVLQRMCDLKDFQDLLVQKPLVVKVFSFSYKKGIPNDDSGNGGGFVFDCRAVNNPGKYQKYELLTGLDQPVIEFLETDGEISDLLEQAYAMVDASVKRYKDRKFTNLMVSFGCTGGRHRSVYAAQKMAQRIRRLFDVEVQLVHREQNIETVFPV